MISNLSCNILSSFTRSTIYLLFLPASLSIASDPSNIFALNRIAPNLLYNSIMSTPPYRSLKISAFNSSFIMNNCCSICGSSLYTSCKSDIKPILVFRDRNSYSLSSSNRWLEIRYRFVLYILSEKKKSCINITFQSLSFINTITDL